MSLSTIRDLLIVIGIYLYFIAWVYLHAYYESFGISTESLRLDYSSYLIFSYNVITSAAFVCFAAWATVIGLLACIGFSLWFRKASRGVQRWMAFARPIGVAVAMVALFPLLFGMSRDTALANYAKDRTNTGDRHRIQFLFREDAGFGKKLLSKDSVGKTLYSSYDQQLLTSDNGKTLRYLGETDEYFIVLHQAQDPGSAQIPEGAVYYVDKKDVLLSHIILSSR
jgi:hypothetical protein